MQCTAVRLAYGHWWVESVLAKKEILIVELTKLLVPYKDLDNPSPNAASLHNEYALLWNKLVAPHGLWVEH